MIPETLRIEDDQSWQKFRSEKRRLDLIVDPMVFRAGEVFLRGRSGAAEVFLQNRPVGGAPGAARHPDEVWEALSKNVGALVSFFDSIILCDQLPIIDYDATFELPHGYQVPWLVERCNRGEDPILVPVKVAQSVYVPIKLAALHQLASAGPVDEEVARSIRNELSALDYDWRSDLMTMDPGTEDGRLLMRYRLGGLIFGAYAQLTGAGHLLHPKRSRLDLALNLDAGVKKVENEEALFARLVNKAKQLGGHDGTFAQLDGLPPFLPLLLQDVGWNVSQLLDAALELRSNPSVCAYRGFRQNFIREFSNTERFEPSVIRELIGAMNDVKNQFNGGREWPFELKWVVTGFDWAVNPLKLVEDVLKQGPGRRVTRLLARMILAQTLYDDMTRKLYDLWYRG
ncbi:MAG: hypothetical protein U0835_09825 [Isosphaeraceae bacterium]